MEEGFIIDELLQYAGDADSDSDEDNIDYGDADEESEDEESEEEKAGLGLAGPSTSSGERQGTRRVAKRQMVSGKAAKRQRTGRDAETVPLRVITKKYECEVVDCGKSFKTKSNLDRHLVIHSGKRPFACPECDKSFKQKANRTAHLFTHSGERPFACPECDKSFTQKGHLIVHLRIHRNDKCFRCTWPQCTFSATDGSNVIAHIRTKHYRLPASKKAQLAADILDHRDARDYLAKN